MDPDAPADDYRLTYNCLACPDNTRTYNDGYHIIHHANSRLHWSELPSAFIQQLQLHDDKDGEQQPAGPGCVDVGVGVCGPVVGMDVVAAVVCLVCRQCCQAGQHGA